MYVEEIQVAVKHFEDILREQIERAKRIREEGDWIDYSKLKPIIIGVAGGDGIGPYITEQAQRVLEFLLQNEIQEGKVEFRKLRG